MLGFGVVVVAAQCTSPMEEREKISSHR